MYSKHFKFYKNPTIMNVLKNMLIYFTLKIAEKIPLFISSINKISSVFKRNSAMTKI